MNARFMRASSATTDNYIDISRKYVEAATSLRNCLKFSSGNQGRCREIVVAFVSAKAALCGVDAERAVYAAAADANGDIGLMLTPVIVQCSE